MGNRTVSTEAVKRSTWLCILVFAVFGILLFRILMIQTLDFESYQNKVLNQITTESPVAANRGKIYDRNGNVLATNITTYRVFISPSGIKSAQEVLPEGNGTDYADLVSRGLSEILGVSYDEVHKQVTEYTKYLDRTIKRKVDEETADTVREYIDEHSLQSMIYLEAQSTRYYPGGTLGAHMIGFTSSDGVGLYGLEYQYDEYLKGVDGYYIKARDSYGNEMPFDYSSYIEAVDGYHLKTTVDTTVQSFLEEALAQTVADHEAANRACGIVMDVNTGAILAMATSSPFDLNDPWGLDDLSKATLEESGYAEDSDEYAELQRTLLTEMWSNKAVTESYIPGSTFKIVTSAMALEERESQIPASVSCGGSKRVADRIIHCHKRQGHGALTFAEGLQQSCNVWFMTLGELIGVDTYQQYVKAFGYRERTGIDLPGEGSSIFASQMSQLDLAIYAFGQNFNVTPMQQLCAVAAVANGGSLMTPYLVEQITDNAGNVIYQHKVETKRTVVSEEVCKTLAEILEDGVSGNGGAKNAYVAGYRVAAKTGTSEKKGAEFTDKEAYICSTVAFAPADDPEIAIIIIVDEPTKGVLYGSTVAAPYVADALENIMPYLGVTPIYTEEEQAKMAVTVPNCRKYTLTEAIARIEAAGLDYTVVGEQSADAVVTSQSPAPYTKVEKSSGRVILYLGDASPSEDVEVPNLIGKNAVQANALLMGCGLNVRIVGSSGVLSGTDTLVCDQSIAAGSMVAKGTVVTVTFSAGPDENPDYENPVT
ncbi:MAG: PASTA domain-containing protein [Clostridia bacterium]|nr:PASTA domain-containing protein [Clostridia bacterium]